MAETRITDEEMRQFGVGIPAPTGPVGTDPQEKGLSYGQLLIDNIVGLDNNYDSFGEQLGRAFNEDEVGFLKNAGLSAWEGAKQLVTHPIDTTTDIVTDIKNSVVNLAAENLDSRLQRMFGVDYTQATDEQVNQAREAVFSDALTAAEVVPALKGIRALGTGAVEAIPGGLRADIVGQTRALLEGDTDFLKGTPTPQALTGGVGAQVSNQPNRLPMFRQFETGADSGLPDPFFGIKNLGNIFGDKPWQDINTGEVRGSDLLDEAARWENEADYPTLQYAPNISVNQLAEVALGRKSVEETLDYIGVDPDPGVVDYVSNRLEDLKQNPEFIAYTEAYGKLDSPYEPSDELWAGFDSNLPEGVLAEFWSPIPDALDSLQWPRNGMEGYQIKAALTKLPDVRNSELRTVIDAFDPQQRYTLEEAKDLASRSGWTVQARELETPNWRGMQRQRDLEDPEVAYSEITVDATRADPERATYQHRGATHGYDNALAHTRVSVRTPRNGNDYYLLVEEMQSDLVQKGSQKPRDAQFTTSPAEAVAKLEDVSDEERKLLTLLGEDRHYQYYNWEGYRDFIDEIGAAELIGTDSLNGIPVTTDVVLDLVGNDNGYGSAESLLRLWSNWKSGSPSTDMVPSPDAWDFYDDVKDTFWQRVQPNIVTGENRPGISHPPVKSTDETVRMTIQALLAKAQQEGIDRIVIPPLERIAAERFDPGSKSFEDAITPGSGFYDTYVTAVSKAVEELGLTSRPVQMNYPGGDILSQTANKIADVMTSRGGSFARTSDFWIDYLENGGLQADARAFMEDRRSTLPSGMDSYDFMGVRNGLENSNIYGFDLRDWVSNPDQVPFSQAMSHRSERSLPSVGTEILIQDVGNQNLRRPRFAEGGLAMENQMNRLMAEGGLNDDGMAIDPVSGNEVPPGSMAEEVRDDIPAQLSGGEYVVPADVVRYYGVKFFEDLRGEAKMGLEGMEADGRIGGEPAMSEAAPAGLSEEDMAMLQQMASQQIGMAEGGMVQNNYLNEDQLIDNIINVAKGSPELMGKLNQKGVMFYKGGLVHNYSEGGFTPTFNVADWATVGGSYFDMPTGNQDPIENKVYRGPNGESITVRFQGGVPLDAIPDGYVPEDQYVSSALGSTSRSDSDRDRPFSADISAPTTSSEPKSFDENGMYRGVSFEDPVGAAKEAYENTQGTFANRAIAGVAGFFGGPLAGQAAKEFVVGNNVAKIRANLRVAEEYGTPEQVEEIQGILKQFEENSPRTFTTSDFFENVLWSGNKIFEDASNVWAETGGVRTPQGVIQAVSSGAGLDRAKTMTADEVQAGKDYAKKGDDRDTSWAGGKVATNQNKPTYTSDKERKDAVEKAVAATGVRATGGRARGGLMGNPKKL